MFIFWDAFIICKMKEKPGQVYQECHIQLQYFSVGPEFHL